MVEKLDLVIEKVSTTILDTFSRDRTNYYDQDEIRSQREELLLKQTIKDATKKRTKVYRLYDKSAKKTIGLIALSTSRLDDKPALLIDYIFIANVYRKKSDNFSFARLLISYAFDKGLILQEEVGLSNLILYPDGEHLNLIKYYKKTYGFQEIREKVLVQNKAKNEKWMYLPLKER